MIIAARRVRYCLLAAVILGGGATTWWASILSTPLHDDVLESFVGVGVAFEDGSSLSPSLRNASSIAKIGSGMTEKIGTSSQKPKGVFIFKVQRAEQACRTICTLTRFLNNDNETRYPIRIFADYNYTDETLRHVREVAGDGVDVKVIVDTQRWRDFPSTLTSKERAAALQECEEHPSPDRDPRCTKMKVRLGYVYMGYWRYHTMGYEDTLTEFEYFVSLDADAYLTQERMPDPFKLMADHNLTGIFNIEAYQAGSIATGIQTSAEAVVPLREERRKRYLNSPNYTFFDESGTWGYGGRAGSPSKSSAISRFPSIWGCFYGGRLDFFRTEPYREFARLMTPYTYIYRTDEQPVIGVAWSLLADNDRVWYLPKRGIEMGVYHHGWIDNSEILRIPRSPDGDNGQVVQETNNRNRTAFTKNTLGTSWVGFQEQRDGLLTLGEYLDTRRYAPDDSVHRCLSVSSK